ncbi:MAG: hypothetical protein EAZ73_09185 [Oscillatoriales cyanobacterium]|uniref:hypothetical protein n=1 Tax=unclassified Microcoleus TaxID=2642155 RepID=UPI001DD5D8C6|nr:MULTISPECIES: hypothetical protein [unclassified Microcoleus]TAF00852.1 MAG: hypothetical protein EAZ79_01410 [Oscillatoriales cyanobacterium]MCC3459810.1 hypothetical protein [Microcoleus sp. PH2017_11_PCY_U_A]MCC3478244.1 hypothetical protein [Microcoleus sp. PH2017_12_PCY_D_A]TAF21389.1 MAG: hypothetical protein EAZ73_09185 [Oscillatoriales cyanobacterium]TAF39684.1 MAG: hypothetical protein EAZ69_00160 [Oscillatoriales cyanobacterium]
MRKRITAFFTGNYWITKDYRKEIDRLIDLAIEQNTRHFLCGMQLGFDQVVADILIDRRLPWTAVLAHPNIDRPWKPRQRSRFRKQLEKAPQIVILYPQGFHGSKAIAWRHMIRKSDICLSINSGFHWDSERQTDRGGPGDVIDLAIANNLQVFQINPVGRALSVTNPPKQLCFCFQ